MLTLTNEKALPNAILCLEKKYGEPWKKFWSYFNRVWMTKYSPRLWCVPTIIEKVNLIGGGAIVRTNCALERFNRRLNDNLRTHPKLKVTSLVLFLCSWYS